MKKSKKTILTVAAALLAVICIVIAVIYATNGSKVSDDKQTDKTQGTATDQGANTDTAAGEDYDGRVIAISEMAKDAVIGQDVVLTFTENEDFFNAIENVIVNGKSLPFEKTNGTITIKGEYIKFPVVHTIQVEAGIYKTATVYQDVKEEEQWELIWSDEFEDDALDTSKWDYQIGTGAEYGLQGWGNDEAQYYSKDNVSVGKGVLSIEAKPDTSNAGTKYTSGRIRSYSDATGALFSTTFGRVEAKMKLPVGSGLWPAFWMLPATDTYTTWAASGEIDIMEARGRLPGESSGALHYGEIWPNNKYSGAAYTFEEDTSINDYHVYTLEWDVDKIKWYVDGNMFYQTDSWFSKGAGEPAEYAFPAPFDEPFYILFNLAVGGTFDGYNEPEEKDFPAIMEVDYVRVYHRIDGYDLNKARGEKLDKASFESYQVYEDGNYITDVNFDSINPDPLTSASMDPTSKQWYFLTISDYGGTATLSKEHKDNGTYVGMEVSKVGNQNYSIQLIQHLPVANGYTYTISFDAYASKEREIAVKLGGDGDNAWAVYSSAYAPKLTTEPQHFEYAFTMSAVSDPTARLEFNIGLDDGTVFIGNVKVTASSAGSVDPDKVKEALTSGNHIYNSSFTQGSDRLAFWHLEAGEDSGVKTDKKVLINPIDGSSALLYQTGILLKPSADYNLSFSSITDAATEITVQVTDADRSGSYAEETIAISGEGANSFTFTMPEEVPEDGVTLTFRIGNTAVKLDDILLVD